MDVFLYKLYTEKSDIAIDEIYVFTYSNEVFKLSASSCVCFVEHLTTRFYGFSTHSQLLCSYDKITRPLFLNKLVLFKFHLGLNYFRYSKTPGKNTKYVKLENTSLTLIAFSKSVCF